VAASKLNQTNQPGLAVVLSVGSSGAAVLFPEATGVLPAWCAHPDATGTSKLTTLAQELGMILLPEEFMPEDFKAEYVGDLAEAIRLGGVADTAAVVPFVLQKAEGSSATAWLLWPVAQPQAVFTVRAKPVEPSAAPTQAVSGAASKPTKQASPRASSSPHAVSLQDLPVYARSLLRVQVPVVVTLAQKRQRLSRILELGPGSIIQFSKSCEEMLDLSVGGQRVASGEAVKVGDKFGLRIQAMAMPEERFVIMGKTNR
jgi:flagellar motor switch/type III secretory pathway protein FliN